MFSGKEKCLTEIHELGMQPDGCCKEIHALQEQKSGIWGQVGGRVAESGGFDPCLLVNDEIGVLMEEKKGCAAVFEHLMSERRNVLETRARRTNSRHFRGNVKSCKN